MHQVRLSEKGQVTLPKKIRDHYHLSKGDEVRLIDLGNGIMEVILLTRLIRQTKLSRNIWVKFDQFRSARAGSRTMTACRRLCVRDLA